MRLRRWVRWNGCAVSLRRWRLLAAVTGSSKAKMAKVGNRAAMDSETRIIGNGRMAISRAKPGVAGSLETTASRVALDSNRARMHKAAGNRAAALDSRQGIARASAAARAVTCVTAVEAVPMGRSGATSTPG